RAAISRWHPRGRSSRAARSRELCRPRSGYRRAQQCRRRCRGQARRAQSCGSWYRLRGSARHDRPKRIRSYMMASVIVERHEGVCAIILNRPAILNAVNRETIAELAAAMNEAAEDRSARVVVLRGAGTHFCAGGDITMFAELIQLAQAERQKALYGIVDT